MNLYFQAFNSVFLGKNYFNYKINYRIIYGANHKNHKRGNII